MEGDAHLFPLAHTPHLRASRASNDVVAAASSSAVRTNLRTTKHVRMRSDHEQTTNRLITVLLTCGLAAAP